MSILHERTQQKYVFVFKFMLLSNSCFTK